MGGELIFRSEDLDAARYQIKFASAMLEDLRWFGLRWVEGPDVGGSRGPYEQRARMNFYNDSFERLRVGAFIYPCICSRRDIQSAVAAPHAADDEVIYPGTCRGRYKLPVESFQSASLSNRFAVTSRLPLTKFSWRFRVPDGEAISFHDENLGEQTFIAGQDFGDFVVWRSDGIPAYQLACVTDDVAMGITEVVRGADLLVSTARQLLIYRALGMPPPKFFHCELMRDQNGERLAKRHDALSLRALRDRGFSPEELRIGWQA